MSIKVTQNAWEYSRQTGTRLLVLLALADYANDRGISWPSQKRLAERARTTRRTIMRHLRALEEAGEIFSIQRSGTSSLYLVTLGFSEQELSSSLRDVLKVSSKRIKQHTAGIIERRGYAKSEPPLPTLREGGCDTYVRGDTDVGGQGGDTHVRGDAHVRGDTDDRGDMDVRGGVTPMSGGDTTPVSGGGDTRVRGGVTPVSPKPSVNRHLTPQKRESSSSSSSSRDTSEKAAADEAGDHDRLRDLLVAAGISAQNRGEILENERIRIEDVLAELARCHAPASRIRKPHLITPMNLLQGDFPDATWYDPTAWATHIPGEILSRAGLQEEIQAQIPPEQEYTPSPQPGGNGTAPLSDPSVPAPYRQAWEAVRGQLRLDMPRASFESWVKDMRLQRVEDQRATFSVRNPYARDWLEERLSTTLQKQLSGSLGEEIEVHFIVQEPTH